MSFLFIPTDYSWSFLRFPPPGCRWFNLQAACSLLIKPQGERKYKYFLVVSFLARSPFLNMSYFVLWSSFVVLLEVHLCDSLFVLIRQKRWTVFILDGIVVRVCYHWQYQFECPCDCKICSLNHHVDISTWEHGTFFFLLFDCFHFKCWY